MFSLRDALEANIKFYARKAEEHGFTKDEVLYVVTHARHAIFELSKNPHCKTKVTDIIKQYHDKVVNMRKERKEAIRADVERHIRHCAMRYNTTQDEVIEIIKSLLSD